MSQGEIPSLWTRWRPYWKHLRLPFQLSLAPLFFWGCFLVPEIPRPLPLWDLLLAFVAFHCFLYTGVTAFNSAYDRDEGPIGGMYEPPPVPKGLLGFSLIVQAMGAVLAALVNLPLLGIYLTIAVLAAAYSHPLMRWKGSAVGSAVTVCIGQGALGFLAGWAAMQGGLAGIGTERCLLGMASAAFTTLGFYPQTQVYQVEEDSRRGDKTLAVVLGPEKALHFGLLCLTLAGVLSVIVMLRHFTRFDALCITGAYGFILWQVNALRLGYRRGTQTVRSVFLTVMRLNYVTAFGFLVFIALHLLRA